MNVLVTGGLGFVGSNLVDRLVKDGNSVYVIDNLSSASSSSTYIRKEVTYWIDDILTINDHKEYLSKKFDVIYHLAAIARIQPSFHDPLSYMKTDALGTASICEYARKTGAKVVYAGSSSAYGGHFLNPYSFAKFTGEQVCKLYREVYGTSTVVARFFNVYGRRQPTTGEYATVIGVFENLKKMKKPLTVTGSGEQRRDFTHVDDIVEGLIKLGGIDWSSSQPPIFNIGTGVNYSINELARMFGGEVKYIPARPGEADVTQANVKALEDLGWKSKIDLQKYISEFLTTLECTFD